MEYTDTTIQPVSRLRRYICVAAGVIFCCGAGLALKPSQSLSSKFLAGPSIPEVSQELHTALSQVQTEVQQVSQQVDQINEKVALSDTDRRRLAALKAALDQLTSVADALQGKVRSGQTTAEQVKQEVLGVMQQGQENDARSKARWEELQHSIMALLQPGDNGVPRYSQMTVAQLQPRALQFRNQVIANAEQDRDMTRQLGQRALADAKAAEAVAREALQMLFPHGDQEPIHSGPVPAGDGVVPRLSAR